jgi:hypothetical protein
VDGYQTEKEDGMSTMLRLYEITDEMLDIERALEEAGGELTPEMEAQLDAVAGAFDEKVERVCAVIQNAQRTADAAKLEAERLADLSRANAKSAESLKRYLAGQMARLGRNKVATDRFRVSLQNNSRPSIRWTLGPERIPELFRTVEIKVDGNAAYEAWKAGKVLPEGFEVERGQHLRIA